MLLDLLRAVVVVCPNRVEEWRGTVGATRMLGDLKLLFPNRADTLLDNRGVGSFCHEV